MTVRILNHGLSSFGSYFDLNYAYRLRYESFFYGKNV